MKKPETFRGYLNTLAGLHESSSYYDEICEVIDTMTEDEIQDLGYWLLDNFFEQNEENEEMDNDSVMVFEVEDIKDMILDIPEDLHPAILEEIGEEQEELDEGVSRIQKQSNVNRKKRKFMDKSKSDLRKEQATRKRKNRMDKAARKRYYRANKAKIASYQKSRAQNIKKGKHNVKLRRKA